ncbi:MAG: sorbosone dehydrogenase family protein [Pseudomonadales bacterium]
MPATIRQQTRALAVVLAGALCLNAMAAQAVEPISDPLPESILPGDIVLRATALVRAPKTTDSGTRGANDAWARIQSLAPIPGSAERLVFNDTRGLLYLTDTRGAEPTVYLDLRQYGGFGFDDAMFPNESGLAGFAFHPDFARPGRPGYGKLYTAYSARSDTGTADYLDDDAASHESVIREWTTTDPGASRFIGASREVFRIGQFAPNHNIGTLAFNPTAQPGDAEYGLLYACLGDGGAANDPRNYAQSTAEPLGAIIRIDPLGGTHPARYGIPADNPFAALPASDRHRHAAEIWAWGLRHPQQFSWDAETGWMYIADIGQNQVEEINLGVRGANYGWRLREGTFATAWAYPGMQPGPVFPRPAADPEPFVYPVAQYDHDEGSATGGGFVYRGRRIPELRGLYVFSDLVRGRLFYIETEGLTPGEPAVIRELALLIDGKRRTLQAVAGIPDTYAPGLRVDLRLGQDAAGELYLLSKSDGWIRRLEN